MRLVASPLRTMTLAISSRPNDERAKGSAVDSAFALQGCRRQSSESARPVEILVIRRPNGAISVRATVVSPSSIAPQRSARVTSALP